VKKSTLLAVLSSLIITTPALAQDDDHGFKHNVIGVFIGKTKSDYSHKASYGLEYEYRFDQTWGAGAVYEKTPEAHDDHHGHYDDISVALVSGYYHYNLLRIGLGFGQEKIHGSHSYTESLVRSSVAYDFHITEHIGIAPAFSLDAVDGHTAKIYGIAINYIF
jgi:hypothetical protein